MLRIWTLRERLEPPRPPGERFVSGREARAGLILDALLFVRAPATGRFGQSLLEQAVRIRKQPQRIRKAN